MREDYEAVKTELMIARDFMNEFDFVNMISKNAERDYKTLLEKYNTHNEECKSHTITYETKIKTLEAQVAALKDDLLKLEALKASENAELLRAQLAKASS